MDSGPPIDKMGLRSAQMGTISVKDILVQEEALLGKEGGGHVHFSTSMHWERIGLSALFLGSMTRLFEDALAFARQREVFGKNIGKYQAISHALAEIKTELEASRLMVREGGEKLASGKDLAAFAAMCNMYVSEMYKRNTIRLLQIYGAKGYINNSDIERSVRDAAASTIYSGTSEILKNIIAQTLRL